MLFRTSPIHRRRAYLDEVSNQLCRELLVSWVSRHCPPPGTDPLLLHLTYVEHDSHCHNWTEGELWMEFGIRQNTQGLHGKWNFKEEAFKCHIKFKSESFVETTALSSLRGVVPQTAGLSHQTTSVSNGRDGECKEFERRSLSNDGTDQATQIDLRQLPR